MRYLKPHFLVWGAALCVMATMFAITPAWAQITPYPLSTFATPKVPLPTTDELLKKDPKVAVGIVAEVLGMVRGVQRTTTDVNIMEYGGSGMMSEPSEGGSWREYKLTRLTMGVDFVIPAARVDMERVGPDGRPQRHIQVVAAKQAWNEEKPGINGSAVTGATDDRVRLIWLSPHGAMWGALRALDTPGSLRLANEGGRLTMSYSLNGEPIKLFLNAAHLPEKCRSRRAVPPTAMACCRRATPDTRTFRGTWSNVPRG